MTSTELVDKLFAAGDLEDREFLQLLEDDDPALLDYLGEAAGSQARAVFSAQIFIRGLIEISNICLRDCYYCGIRKSNRKASRYRLTKEEILGAAEYGYRAGFRTFVLQGGEDPYWTDERLCPLISEMRASFPEAAVTLSLGERSPESYRRLKAAGAERYLLRHETADPGHFARLHPPAQTLAHRLKCLDELRALGWQSGCGFMVGSPGQSARTLLQDLRYIQAFRPHMVGIGPFIPHPQTPLGRYPPGSLKDTLKLLALIRLIDPYLLLPATTALATIDPAGRQKGILAGANVVMPNLSPPGVRAKYDLYEHKKSDGAEAAEHLDKLAEELAEIAYSINFGRGDSPLYEKEKKLYV